MIAVTGATGALGRRVSDRLAAADLRLVVRDAERAPQVAAAEIVANPGGFDDPDGLEAAPRGADTVYLVSAAEHENRLQQHFAAVDAAVAAGVQRIVSRRTTRTACARRSSGTRCTRTSCRSSRRWRTAGP